MLAWELRAFRALGFDMVIMPAAPSVSEFMVSYEAVALLSKLALPALAHTSW